MNEPRHPFFHALVLMGGTVALGCGGIVGQASGDGSAADTGGAADSFANGGGAGSGGSPAFTGAGGAGGEPALLAGGSGGLSTLPGTGGKGPALLDGGGAPVELLPCVPAQWDCARTQLACDYSAGYLVQGAYGCVCDAERPSSPDDCPPGKSFVCEQGAFESDGITVQIPFQCSCVAGPADCSVCRPYSCSTSSTSILCGCVYISLLH